MTNSLDEKLIQALRENARLSTSELARRLDVSRSTVQSRIKKLEQDRIILGYTAQLGEAYRQRLISAQVLIEVEQRLTAKLSEALRAIPQISELHAISGDYDMSVLIQAEGTQALSQLLDEISCLEGVIRTNSSVILETKFQR